MFFTNIKQNKNTHRRTQMRTQMRSIQMKETQTQLLYDRSKTLNYLAHLSIKCSEQGLRPLPVVMRHPFVNILKPLIGIHCSNGLNFLHNGVRK